MGPPRCGSGRRRGGNLKRAPRGDESVPPASLCGVAVFLGAVAAIILDRNVSHKMPTPFAPFQRVVAQRRSVKGVLSLEGGVFWRQVVKDNLLRVVAYTERRLNRICIIQHNALLEAVVRVEPGRSKPHSAISRFDGFHPLSGGQGVCSVPCEKCVDRCLAVKMQHPTVVQSPLPRVVPVHPADVVGVHFGVVVEHGEHIAQRRLRCGVGDPSSVALGSVVKFHIPGEYKKPGAAFAEVDHSIAPIGPICGERVACRQGLRPQFLQLVVQGQSVFFRLGQRKAFLGGHNARPFRALSQRQDGPCQCQENTPCPAL